MRITIDTRLKIMAEFVEYEVWLGTFEGEDFVWKTVKKFNNYKQASKFFEDYKRKQAEYSAEELSKIWGSGRIDIELRQGKKLINWIGMYYRKAADPSFDPEAEEAKEEDVEDAHPQRM